MGESEIRDDDDVESVLPAWRDPFAIEETADGDAGVIGTEGVTPPSAREEREGSDTTAGPRGALAAHYWLALAPTVVAAASTGVVMSGLVPATLRREVTAVLFLVTALTAGLADLWVYGDARRLAATDAPWRPNPWLYFVSGGAVLTVGAWLWIGRPVGPLAGLRAVAGTFLAGLVFSSTLAGPVYLLNRRRSVGLE